MDRPILFSAPMVRALLVGTKTQTRRVLKQATGSSLSVNYDDDTGEAELSWLHGDGPGHEVHETILRVPCRYGRPGDRLYVREAIRLVPNQEPDDGTGDVLSTYEADGSLTVADAWPWKRAYLPPMHCPRGLSRILLEITDVRVERLQDISEADALAEGIECADTIVRAFYAAGSHQEVHEDRYFFEGGDDEGYLTAVDAYAALWEAINGAGSWDLNPFVWVVEFRRSA